MGINNFIWKEEMQIMGNMGISGVSHIFGTVSVTYTKAVSFGTTLIQVSQKMKHFVQVLMK